ncbi:zinc finger protein 16-like isoform X1 [Poecilia reticulata]|uniref:zinc finger protein 16-like isoform X1 n=1 Tax=Poecilia reticulata TaxID=8081 RepID=UPI0004A3E2F3|nr:PREDICTED: zinc finger protein 16-like isoform X1 [Poecilia reticulata]
MADLAAVRSQVVLVVNSLAQTLFTELRTAGHAVRVSSPEPRSEEELGVAVDRLCLDAVDQILKILETSMTRQEEAPPTPADTCGGLMKTPTGGGEQEPGPGHAYFLLYSVSPSLSAAGDARSLLVALQSAEGGSRSSASDLPGEESQVRPASSSPPTDDHEYARPPAPPPGGAKRCGRRQAAAPGSEELHLQCWRCSRLFPSAERLADHHRKSHPLCSVCGAAFSGVLKLREHQVKEHSLLPFACGFCPKSFNHKTHRDLHVKARHTGEKSCRCDICGKGYACVSALKTHRVTHFSKTFMCEVCGKAFHHASHLTRHALVHREPRPFSCSTCGRRFTQAANLRSHQVTHAGEKQLCSVCGKSFRCLRNHMISRHAQEPAAAGLLPPAVTCQVCGKKLPNPSQRRAHQRSHTADKPFRCDVCGRSYRLKELLRDHRYTHGGQKPYRCCACAETFSRASSFLRHRSIHSGQAPHSCQRCGKHFRLRSFLQAHLQTKAHLRRTQQSQSAEPPLIPD